MQVPSLSQEDPLEEEMATHSSILAWKIPWTREPGGLQLMKSQRAQQLSTYSQLTNDVVKVAGKHRGASAIHILMSILLPTPLPSWLPHNTEQSPMCYSVSKSLLIIHFNYISVYMIIPNSLTIPSP